MVSAILDTNILIDHLRGKQSSTDFIKSLITNETKLLCSVITRIELFAGIRPGEENSINSLLKIFNEINVDVTIANLAGKYLNLYMKSRNLTPVDAIIAASAQKYNSTIYTLNHKHFPMKDIDVKIPY
jgi:predicted nucleic acid-binding protein